MFIFSPIRYFLFDGTCGALTQALQVRQSLVRASLTVNGQLWATSLQIAARLAFGLALWATWAAAPRESG